MIKYVELLAAMYTLDNIIIKYVELLAAMYTLDNIIIKYVWIYSLTEQLLILYQV